MKHGAAPVFIVSLRPDPSCKVPGIIGLRRLLKSLLRSYGLVAVDVQEVHAAREFYDQQAKERQKDHGKTAPGKAKTLPANLPGVNADARDQVGKVFAVVASEARQRSGSRETESATKPRQEL